MRIQATPKKSIARRTLREKRPGETQQLQAKLARRMLLVFVFPFVVLLGMGVYAYELSTRVSTLEAGSRVNYIERQYRNNDNANLKLAISEYEKVAEDSPGVEILVRLGGLYYQCATAGGDCDFGIEDAIKTLQRANELHHDKYGGESWQANKTLVYIYLSKGEEFWEEAVKVGEKAIKGNKYDAETHNNLAWIYAESQDLNIKDLAKAKDYAQKAVKLTRYRDDDAVDTLVRVFLKAGGQEPLTKLVDVYVENKKRDRLKKVIEGVLKDGEELGEAEKSLLRAAIKRLQPPEALTAEKQDPASRAASSG